MSSKSLMRLLFWWGSFILILYLVWRPGGPTVPRVPTLSLSVRPPASQTFWWIVPRLDCPDKIIIIMSWINLDFLKMFLVLFHAFFFLWKIKEAEAILIYFTTMLEGALVMGWHLHFRYWGRKNWENSGEIAEMWAGGWQAILAGAGDPSLAGSDE